MSEKEIEDKKQLARKVAIEEFKNKICPLLSIRSGEQAYRYCATTKCPSFYCEVSLIHHVEKTTDIVGHGHCAFLEGK
jgi:hypothetical protein